MTDLSAGWEWTTIGEIGNYLNGRGFKKSEWSDTGRPIIRIQNLTGTGAHFNYFQGDAEERHTVRDGDLLMSWAATLGVFVWRGPEAVLNQHIFKVESHIDPVFHRYLLDHALSDLKRQTHGSGMVHITKGRFDATPVPLPPLAEQKRIVAAIEELLSWLDAAEGATASAGRRLSRFFDSVLQTTFDPSWPRKPLDSRNDPERPICYGILKPRTSKPGEVPYVEVRSIADGRIKLSELHKTTAALHREFRRSELRQGDVALAIRGSFDRAAVVPEQLNGANISRDVARISPIHELMPEFLAAFLVSPEASSFFRRHARGVAVQGINIGDLRRLPVPCPPVEVQVDALQQIDAARSAVQRIGSEVRVGTLRSGQLRRSILVAAFSGKLVPQEPGDEPASVLLERIQAERAAVTPAKRTRKARAS